MSEIKDKFQEYLKHTEFIDSDSKKIIEYANSLTKDKNTETDKAIALFYGVRDGIRYYPYRMDLSRNGLKASTVLERERGFCVPKAILLAAACRAVAIPARLGFADIINHIYNGPIIEKSDKNIIIFHAFTEIYLEDKWVKATPAFNIDLCKMAGVDPIEFDGMKDALFQQFDKKGNKFMEYINHRGSFADVPYEELVPALRQAYPQLVAEQ